MCLKLPLKKSKKIQNLSGKENRENGTTLYSMNFLIDNTKQRFR